MNGNIVVITYQFSVVVKSIEKGLKEANYMVSLLSDDSSKISLTTNETDVYLIYLPDSIMDDRQRVKNLMLIGDGLKDQGKSIILIGSDKNKEDVLNNVPTLRDYLWIDRPVDVKSLENEINKEITKTQNSKARKNVLIIDDDPVYAKIVVGWLGEQYNMNSVTDGMQGISYLANNDVDLILLDYEMPVVDGPKILEMLRMHPDTAKIPVIFLTGIGTKESIARVMNLKPQGYILKTATREELLKNIAGFFDKQNQ